MQDTALNFELRLQFLFQVPVGIREIQSQKFHVIYIDFYEILDVTGLSDIYIATVSQRMQIMREHLVMAVAQIYS
jgi:hypothetical protein